MKICYLTNNLNPKNGWGRYASDLIYGVRNAGHEVVVLKEEDDGLEGVPVLKRGLGVFSSALKIRKFVKDCDMIHALDGYPYGIIAWLANVGLDKKMIITVQGTYGVAFLYDWKIFLLLSQAYRKADKIIAISDYTKREVLKKVRLDNIRVVNHGIDLKKFHVERVQSENKFILSIGALKFRKGYHVSIPAFGLVKKNIPDLKYKIVGSRADANYFNRLKKTVEEAGLENDVEFLSDLNDQELKKIYQTARLFILTSVNHNYHFEGFGLVFLEAAAAGLPVVGTLGNGIENAVKDGYNGILVPQNDIQNTSKAISDILKNKQKQYEMSAASFSWAEKHTLEGVTKKYVSVYEAALNQK